ncbi:MAG: hypothetical protein LAT55_08675 [Opitutales bacterium]|nr:hypothetical protein [Opitutales bacterium]
MHSSYKTDVRMFYLFIIKLFVAATFVKHFFLREDPVFYAGWLTLLQVLFQIFLGHGIGAILYYGVFLFTLWLGYFHFLIWLEKKSPNSIYPAMSLGVLILVLF